MTTFLRWSGIGRAGLMTANKNKLFLSAFLNKEGQLKVKWDIT